MSATAKTPKIPPRIENYLRSNTTSPFFLQGAVIDALHDPFLINNIRELTDSLIAAAAGGKPVAVESKAGADGLAAAAIVRSCCAKLGSPPHPKGQQSLFNSSLATEPLRLTVGDRGLCVTVAGGNRIDIQARQNSPPYPFPALSLSGLALKIADSAFCAGALAFPADFVAFDLETTGRSPRSDEIIEIGAVRVRGGIETAAFSSFVKPRREIPQEVVEITHITPEIVGDAPPAGVALASFLQFCGDMLLVAHNAPFDLAFLRNQVRLTLGREVVNDTEDSLTMARWLYPMAPNHRLVDVAALLGVELADWHRAENDARTAARIYLRLRDRDTATLRDLRLKHYLDLAALGTIASGAPLREENEAIVKYGLGMMLRRFSPWSDSPPLTEQAALTGDEMIEMLLSLEDADRRRAALQLLAGLATTEDRLKHR
jgi:DNA polymerase III epsilon subunit family exonuclease